MAKIPDDRIGQIDIEVWCRFSERQSIKMIREMLGLPEIKSDWSSCARCEKRFMTSFKFNRPMERCCFRCRQIIVPFMPK